ncbi:MAG: thioredoxin domain-containing protein [Deltaproteobacteria bacterium]|nr:thioredoxin domain-containing protein [Deltaproteobacteria bacterium]
MTPVLMGAACEKKKANSDTGAGSALDRASGVGTVDTTPIQGFDLKLDAEKAQTFYRLVGSFESPCRNHSLRASFTKDPDCKRARFALRYLQAMVEDELTEDKIGEWYRAKYLVTDTTKVDVSKAPHHGPEDAPIRLVEFFDYECPACQGAKPNLDKVLAKYEGKVVIYYMMYPLERLHPGSKSAAMAAVAAQQMGKFHEMHEMLFAQKSHDRSEVLAYAQQIGLDMAKFEPLYTAAAAQVVADQKQGETAGVKSTPTLYFNDRAYEAPINPRYLSLWIEEELAVNR